MQATDVLIIGAGISGLICATELRKADKSVRILDKSHGLGGRMATRRMSGGRLDHGAQYFTVRDPRLQVYADDWLAEGIIKEWFRHLPEDSNTDGHTRYCGINGMTDVPKHLAKGLDVCNSQKVIELSRDADLWIALTASGDSFLSKHLVITSPLPQTMNLLDTTGLSYAKGASNALRSVRYLRGLATLAILDGASGLPKPGGIKIHEAPLTWIADNQQKGISPNVSAINIHSDADFAEAYWDSPNEVRGPLMLDAAAPHLSANVLEYDCHRWGFTTPFNPWLDLFFQDAGLQLTLAGDSFGGARVEGAALSGIEAANALLQGLL